MSNPKKIQVFEYQYLHIDKTYDGVLFKQAHFNALVKFNELHKSKYFNIGYKKIQFLNYVGIIQVDAICIEILPKIDHATDNKQVWQTVLIQMLKTTKKLKVHKAGEATVNKQSIHLLDIYFEWFLKEVTHLMHLGLIKQYYTQTKNVKALKGKLEFAGHIQKNSIRKDRFYTSHQVYEKDHLAHQILDKALQIIAQFSKGTSLYANCKKVQLNFPDVTPIQINATTFDKLVLTRKTKPYETVLEIARLIILNYAPNVSSGSEKMLAILFDMNHLWEEYILVQLKKHVSNHKDWTVKGQESKPFIKGHSLRPDIVLFHSKTNKTIVIDTKWKLGSKNISVSDLRQVYTYSKYWNAEKVMLLYPNQKEYKTKFLEYKNEFDLPTHYCKLGFITILNTKGNILNNIGEEVYKLLEIDEEQ